MLYAACRKSWAAQPCLVVFVQGLKEHSWKFQVCVGSRGIAGDYSDAREVLRA